MNTKLQAFSITLIIAFLLSASVTSAAQPSIEKHNKFMQFFDANNDGVVTYEEFQRSSKKRFERIDADTNAAISEEEFSNYMQTRHKERQKNHFENVDANKDGKVSKDEFLASERERAKRHFDRMDKDKDGLLSTDELTSHKKHRARFSKKVFAKLDTNSDRQVTQEESQTAWSKWFKRMDANNDQVVSGDEVEQARSRW